LIIKIDPRLFTRALTFLPPILGIVIFTYLVKYSGFESVPIRIPIFQGLTAYFSLILLGFTYIKNRQNIFGIKIIPLLAFIIIFPTVFYTYNGIGIIFTLLFVLIQSFSLIIAYISIIKGNINNYLLLGCINSIVLPLCLAFNELFLLLICICLLILLLYILLPLRTKLGSFDYSGSGLNAVKSILLQSPLIILPFFDFKIAELIGLEKYSNYVLIFKYINGFIVLLYSYKQLNLTFSGVLSKKKIIVYQLLAILITLIICSNFESYFLFAVSIALFSYGINLCSLLIRKALLDGISFLLSIIGLISVFLYVLLIYEFGKIIIITNSAFIVFMYISSFTTALFINILNKKRNHFNFKLDEKTD